ncbi:hypothetical protein [Arachnia propionica]|uniref:hypothetical protein n=1 Tax=Arachnia propionica TaxID=1750 RepID=UPI000F831B41|nr:hypothetical protein [Arachnia propionica]
MPRPALARVLDSFAHGEGVTVVPTQAELTTQQAADALHVLRLFLIGVLDAGQIEYRTVGTHRRAKAASLICCPCVFPSNRLIPGVWKHGILTTFSPGCTGIARKRSAG